MTHHLRSSWDYGVQKIHQHGSVTLGCTIIIGIALVAIAIYLYHTSQEFYSTETLSERNHGFTHFRQDGDYLGNWSYVRVLKGDGASQMKGVFSVIGGSYCMGMGLSMVVIPTLFLCLTETNVNDKVKPKPIKENRMKDVIIMGSLLLVLSLTSLFTYLIVDNHMQALADPWNQVYSDRQGLQPIGFWSHLDDHFLLGENFFALLSGVALSGLIMASVVRTIGYRAAKKLEQEKTELQARANTLGGKVKSEQQGIFDAEL